jgi:ribokinase
MSDVVIVGSLNVDLVIKSERLPAPGENIPGQDFKIIPGGKGANQAASIARLGSRVAMVGRVGADLFGPRLIENLTAQGVDAARVSQDLDAPTGTALIVVDRAGENSIIVVSGANGRVSGEDVRAAEELIRAAKALILQFEIPLASVEHAMDIAARHGVPVVLNAAPAKTAPDSLLAKADYLIVNEWEARALTGVDVGDVASGFQAADRLRGMGVGVVILTLGERGALLASPQQTTHFPTRAVQVVDTTAAGDAFVAAFGVSLIGGLDLPQAIRFANAAGTLAVTRFGAQPSLPTRAEVEAFLRA